MKTKTAQQPKAGKPRKIYAAGEDINSADPITLYSRKDCRKYPVPVLVLPCDAASVAARRKKIAQTLADLYWRKKGAAIGFIDYGVADAVLAALGLGLGKKTK